MYPTRPNHSVRRGGRVDDRRQDVAGRDPTGDDVAADRPRRCRGDAGFLVSEGLAYAGLFVGVMLAISGEFTNLGSALVGYIRSTAGF